MEPTDSSNETPKSISKEDVLKWMDEHFPAISTFINTHIKLMEKSTSKDEQYSPDFMQFALALYFMGPRTYKFLRNIYQLPSKLVLQRITKQWEIRPGFSDFLFAAFQLKADSLQNRAKDCTLCIDEMDLKTSLYYDIRQDEVFGFHHTLTDTKSYKPADKILTFMARGINADWSQLLGYFFVNNACPVEDLKDIILEGVRRLRTIGLRVRATVSTQKSNFVSLAVNLGITANQPFFDVDGESVLYMFDVLDLLKSTRNSFFNHSFVTNNGVTEKSYLEEFYAVDARQKYRLSWKLRPAHLHPNASEKMNILYAAQVLSQTVAAGISTHITCGKLPEKAEATASFIHDMDELFDVMNSSKCTKCRDVKLFNKPFVDDEKQRDILHRMNSMFRTLKILSMLQRI